MNLRIPILPLALCLAVCPPFALPCAGVHAGTQEFAGDGAALGPRIHCANPDLDYGEIFQFELKYLTYVLENRGDADLEIIQIAPKCGCNRSKIFAGNPRTEVVIDRKAPIGSKPIVVVKPGETIDLEVVFDATALPPKPIAKPIWIRSNDTTQPKYRLMAKAQVKLALLVEPKPLFLGDVIHGRPKTARAIVRLDPDVELNVTGVESDSAALSAKLEVLDADAGTRAWAVDVTFSGDAPYGLFNGMLIIRTDHPRITKVILPVNAAVCSPVRFECGNQFESIRFGQLPGNRPVTRTVEIVNDDPAVPYRITGIEIDSKHADSLEAVVEEVEAGVRYRVHVTARETLHARFFRGNVIIKSAYEGLESKSIPLMGQG